MEAIAGSMLSGSRRQTEANIKQIVDVDKIVGLCIQAGQAIAFDSLLAEAVGFVLDEAPPATVATGIDLVAGGKSKKTKRTAPKSNDIYLQLLVKLCRFLVRRTGSKFNAVILKRQFISKVNKASLSLSSCHFVKGKEKNCSAYWDYVTDDIRAYEVPVMKVTDLRFTKKARARIEKAGGECLTFDQLAQSSSWAKHGANCAVLMQVLLRGPVKSREAAKHFGPTPSVPHSHTKLNVRAKGRKFERARDRFNFKKFASPLFQVMDTIDVVWISICYTVESEQSVKAWK
ncbi:60S ribosomal L18-2-like [Olea europaea subsp. europaea]|uniref:60S ribosomal L18-2-like n=1 Tax=Olea europaea subsp. europaea TaxID=158383 RepID=A0A8S0U157_OLEEU|nr:60S ribosomal L18-2-like [Olea europaea subsp. europaea]